MTEPTTTATTIKTGHYWRHQATIRQNIINKLDRRVTKQAETIANLTASVVQLENDYDQVESELQALTAGASTEDN